MKSKVTIGVMGKNEQDSKASRGLQNMTMTVTSRWGPEKLGQKRTRIRLFLKAAAVSG